MPKKVIIEQTTKEIEKIEQKNELTKLEEFYVTGKVSDLSAKIKEQEEKIAEEIAEYSKSHYEAVKWSRDGDPIEYAVKYSPIVVTNRFFKSIIPLNSVEPEYTPERLSLVFDYYCYILAEVNDQIGYFPSSLTSFCKMAGITTNTLRQMKNSSDLNMRIIVEKIYDQIGDENLTMAQLNVAKERSTLFKLKSQHEMVEKVQPSVHINITEKPDYDKIQAKLNKYKVFADKKGNK